MSHMMSVPYQANPILMSPAQTMSAIHPLLAQPLPLYSIMIPNRIFVGGLSDDTSTIDLRDSFSAFGTVMYTTIIFDNDGYNRGYGFVTFRTEAEAQGCMGQCVVIHNRRVNIAQAFKKRLAQRAGGIFYISAQSEMVPPGAMALQHYAAPGWVQAAPPPSIQCQPIHQYFNAVPTECNQDCNQELNCAQSSNATATCNPVDNQEWDAQETHTQGVAWEYDVGFNPN